jgi:hypothetical protein
MIHQSAKNLQADWAEVRKHRKPVLSGGPGCEQAVLLDFRTSIVSGHGSTTTCLVHGEHGPERLEAADDAERRAATLVLRDSHAKWRSWFRRGADLLPALGPGPSRKLGTAHGLANSQRGSGAEVILVTLVSQPAFA